MTSCVRIIVLPANPNLLATMSDTDKCCEFEETMPLVYEDVVKSIGNIDIMANIFDNLHIYFHLENSKCTMLVSLSEAFFELEKKNGALLIHVTKLNLYCVFTAMQYEKFVTGVRINGKYDGPLSTELLQIVLCNKYQKFVFACSDKDHFNILRNHASECFGNAKTKVAGDQITVDIMMQSEMDIANHHEKLHNYVCGRDDGSHKSMRHVEVFTEFGRKIRKYQITDVFNAAATSENVLAFTRGCRHFIV